MRVLPKKDSHVIASSPEADEAISPHPFAANEYAEIASSYARGALLAKTFGLRLGLMRVGKPHLFVL
jgi:hypothetical protein